mgnify:CR=1 FL=1
MKANVKNGQAITPKQNKPEKEPAKTPVNAVTSRTKQVNNVVNEKLVTNGNIAQLITSFLL